MSTYRKPDNMHPLLLCEGACDISRHVAHSYIGHQRQTGTGGDVTWYDLFRCDACGAVRVYGATA